MADETTPVAAAAPEKPKKRVFLYNNARLEDIPGKTPVQVKEHYSSQIQELVTATISGPVIKGDTETYTFEKAIVTKG